MSSRRRNLRAFTPAIKAEYVRLAMRNPNLSQQDRLIYAALVSLSNENGICTASLNQIADKANTLAKAFALMIQDQIPNLE